MNHTSIYLQFFLIIFAYEIPADRWVDLILWSLASRAQGTIPSLDLRLLERLNHGARPGDKKWLAVSNILNVVLLATPTAMGITGLVNHNNV